MIVFLIGLGQAPSVPIHVLAHQLERHGDHAVVHEPSPRRGWRRHLDRIIASVDDARPGRVGIGCDLWNGPSVLELCLRLRAQWPQLPLVLWGGEAARVARLATDAGPIQVLPDPELLGGLCGHDGAGPLPFCRDRLGELVQACARFQAPVRVERLAGTPLPLHQHRSNGLPVDEGPGVLTLEQAMEWLGPLLRAGVAVRLEEPALTVRRDTLHALLERAGPGRLVLEIPAELLDEDLARRVVENGMQQLDLDLSQVGGAEQAPEGLRGPLRLLGEAGLRVRGMLVYPRPGVAHADLGAVVDRCLAAGIEDLVLNRLVVPPGSPLGAQRSLGLVVAPRAPYEVLAHAQMPPAHLLRWVRLAETLDLLREVLVGTGVLRALGDSGHSAFELLEGFGESLAARAVPGERELPRPVERLFADHLRLHHGVDLEAGVGQLRLVRSPGLSLRWMGNGSRLVTDDATGRVAHMGRSALALIDHCEQAQTIHELCEQLVGEARAEQRDRLRRELRITVDKLATMGFLVPALDGRDTPTEPPFTSLDEFDYHYRMLMDATRVDAYRRAIARAVRPGQHVLEVGTGTGILAVLAAQAGARVTAIERYAVLEIAREVARRSGVGHRIEFIRGRSDLVTLDEPADVLVSELVGNRILNEGLLEVTLDARQRLLRPDACLVPHRIEILAQLGHCGRFSRLEQELEALTRRCQVDLSPLAQWVRSSMTAGTLVWEQGSDAEGLETLSGEATAVAVDLRTFDDGRLGSTFSLEATRQGQVNGVVLSFVLALHDGVELTTRGPRHDLHWNRPVIMLPGPIAVEPGQTLRFELSYELGADLRLVQVIA